MTAGMTIGINGAYGPPSLAPEIAPMPFSSSPASLPLALGTLYELRDRPSVLPAPTPFSTTFVSLDHGTKESPAESTLRDRFFHHAIDARIHIEKTAYYHWRKAQTLAQRAQQLEQQQPLTPVGLEESDVMWRAAIQHLEAMPPSSSFSQPAFQQIIADTIAEYQTHRSRLAYRYNTQQSELLRDMVEDAGVAGDAAHITVCSVAVADRGEQIGECRRLNGDRPPTSAASLIKVPIAVALMQKLAASSTDLSTEIYITPHNYTEDASDIGVGRYYSLRRLAARMINQSSNIATNQLIDYLGVDYINGVLGDRGYQTMTVGHKLAGDRTMPTHMVKPSANRITTDELTGMMAAIYHQPHPGNAVLRDILATQTDERMGRTTLNGNGVEWLGEKTGWNSSVLGTTASVAIEDNPYIITVVLHHPTDIATMQSVLRSIADHLLIHNGF